MAPFGLKALLALAQHLLYLSPETLLEHKHLCSRSVSGDYFPIAITSPSTAPIMALIKGLFVRRHAPLAHFPKYPIPNPTSAPIDTPNNIFITDYLRFTG